MKIQTVLRISVSLVLVSFIIVRVLTVLLHDSLPPQLRDWSAGEPTQSPATAELLGGLGTVIFVSWLVGVVGLLFLKRWARWLFLFSAVAGYAFMPLSGPTVAHGLTSAVDGVFAVLSGITLALAFFTEALKPNLRAESATCSERRDSGADPDQARSAGGP